ncbi:MAG TPA: right-handed parallel beta-helix repeat-containing protein, partial [Dermatophilaceae bacterium]
DNCSTRSSRRIASNNSTLDLATSAPPERRQQHSEPSGWGQIRPSQQVPGVSEVGPNQAVTVGPDQTDRASLYDNTFKGGGVGVLSIMSKNYGMVLSRNSFIGLGLGVDTSISATVTIDNNVFKGNGASGLNLRDVWAGTVTGNTFVGNGFSPGIYADPSGNPLTAGLWTSIDGNGTIAHNTAIGNAGYGIEAHGAVDGGGNIARGNGNPAQCLGVVCTKK